jgi:hypothetical protein
MTDIAERGSPDAQRLRRCGRARREELEAVSEQTSSTERQVDADEEQPEDEDLSQRHADLNNLILRHLALLEVLRRRSTT